VTTVTIVYDGPNASADVLRLLARLLHGSADTATVREIKIEPRETDR
jgi:hypothetical protein